MIRRQFLKFLGAVPVVGAAAVLAVKAKGKAGDVTPRKGYRKVTEEDESWSKYSSSNPRDTLTQKEYWQAISANKRIQET